MKSQMQKVQGKDFSPNVGNRTQSFVCTTLCHETMSLDLPGKVLG